MLVNVSAKRVAETSRVIGRAELDDPDSGGRPVHDAFVSRMRWARCPYASLEAKPRPSADRERIETYRRAFRFDPKRFHTAT
ncbi:hypothetical protein AKJ09_04938 [Labilithrix luteola]|uniref:Uncharacterized protein n=1 Tax=Labilithrix luteola TaxID=1391654 RepID=A0A0K1PYR0_9BACT|nr:hypothetical protein AKJ09_04938 [Labilithrix luteola]